MKRSSSGVVVAAVLVIAAVTVVHFATKSDASHGAVSAKFPLDARLGRPGAADHHHLSTPAGALNEGAFDRVGVGRSSDKEDRGRPGGGFTFLEKTPTRSPEVAMKFVLEYIRHGRGTKVLTVGTRMGDFPAYLRHHGVDAWGVEVNPDDCAVTRSRGVPVVCKLFEKTVMEDFENAPEGAATREFKGFDYVYYWWGGGLARNKKLLRDLVNHPATRGSMLLTHANPLLKNDRVMLKHFLDTYEVLSATKVFYDEWDDFSVESLRDVVAISSDRDDEKNYRMAGYIIALEIDLRRVKNPANTRGGGLFSFW